MVKIEGKEYEDMFPALVSNPLTGQVYLDFNSQINYMFDIEG